MVCLTMSTLEFLIFTEFFSISISFHTFPLVLLVLRANWPESLNRSQSCVFPYLIYGCVRRRQNCKPDPTF